METRYAVSPQDAKNYDTEQLRKSFLVEDLFQEGKLTMVYSHYDRMIVGGAVPTTASLTPEAPDTLKTEYFFERREAGFINIGGDAVITVDGTVYELGRLDALYVSKGTKDLRLTSADPAKPARLYMCSAPAHAVIPTKKMALQDATPKHMGASDTCNERTIYQYIHADGTPSCQLMMGVTIFQPGSVWNTMPAHVHDRRMEAYLYFDMSDDARVFHFMGEPQETRHIVVKNEQVVLSPSWSIHSGAGTSNYTFIWAMAGENYTFTDMDWVAMEDLK